MMVKEPVNSRDGCRGRWDHRLCGHLPFKRSIMHLYVVLFCICMIVLFYNMYLYTKSRISALLKIKSLETFYGLVN